MQVCDGCGKSLTVAVIACRVVQGKACLRCVTLSHHFIKQNLFMKNVKKLSSYLLLPMMALMVFASCEQEEVIPLMPEDTGSDLLVDSEVQHHNHYMDEDGNLLGYIANDGTLLNLNREPMVTNPAAKDDLSNKFAFAIYQHSKFQGSSAYSGLSNSAGSISISSSTYAEASILNAMSSVVVAPNSVLYLYSDANYSNLIKSYNNFSDKALYVSYIGNDANDKVRSLRVSFYAGKGYTNDYYCGFAYKGSSYSGDRLPVFYEHALSQANLNGWSFINNIRGFAMNMNGRCAANSGGNGVFFSNNRYDAQGISYPVQGILVQYDQADLGSGYRINTESIIPDGDYSPNESDWGLTQSEASYVFNNQTDVYANFGYRNSHFGNQEQEFCTWSKGFCEWFDDLYMDTKGFGAAFMCVDFKDDSETYTETITGNGSDWKAAMGGAMAAAWYNWPSIRTKINTYYTNGSIAYETAVADAFGAAAELAPLIYLGCMNRAIYEDIVSGNVKSCDEAYDDCVNEMY